MDAIHLRKAIALITRGLLEKDQLIKEYPNRYPYSKRFHHGMNMFLVAAMEIGGVGEKVFEYADESRFLKQYVRKPVTEWFYDWKPEVIEKMDLENQPFYIDEPLAYYQKRQNRYVLSEEGYCFLEMQENNIIEGTDEHALYELIVRLPQEEYCTVRKFIIEHLVLSVGTAFSRNIKRDDIEKICIH